MPDDPYRFGFSAPGDEIPDVDPTDGFHRDSQGHWVENGDSCDICYPPPRQHLPEEEHIPYDPETDPF